MLETKRPVHSALERLRAARRTNPAATAGVILIVAGVITALTQTVLGGAILLLLAGMAFVGWSIVRPSYRPLALGMTMIGLGVGVFLVQTDIISDLTIQRGTGVVLLSMGVAMLVVPPLEVVFTPYRRFWILIPGVISTGVGIAFIVGGRFLDFVQRLRWIGNLWPIAPIVVGLYLLFVVARRQSEPPPTEA